MNVLFYLKDRQNPINATLNDLDLDRLTAGLNDKILFLKLGGEIINRELISKIVEVVEQQQPGQATEETNGGNLEG